MKNTIKLSLVASVLVATLSANDDFASATVYSGSFEHSEINASSPTEIYTQVDIEKSNATDLYQFLNEQTSITTMPSYGNPFSQKIDMRGFGITDGYQNIVITIDGRRMNNIDMVPQLLASISIDNIKQIEILKGSGSVEYGDGATAGAINIITNGKSNNYIKTYYGNNNTKYGIVSLGHNTEELIINAKSDYYTTNGAKNDDRYSKNKSIDIKYFPVDDLELRAKRTFANMETKYANSLTLDEFNTDITKDKGFVEHAFNSYATSLGFLYDINSNISLEVDYNDEDKVSNFITWSSSSNYNYKSLNSKLKIRQDNLKVSIGINKFDGERIGSSNTISKDNEGAFMTSSYAAGDTTITAGGRYEEVNYIYTPNAGAILEKKEYLNSWNIGVNQTLNERQSIFANYNKAFQTPDIDRFFISSAGWGSPLIFNSFIEPSKVRTINIGFNDFSSHNNLKATIFRSNLTNEIYYYKSGAWSGINTNIDKSHKYGLEVFDKYKLNKNTYVSVNYNYIIAKIDNENEAAGAYNGKDLPGVSKHNVTVNYGFNLNKYSGVLSHKYRSSAYASEDFSNSFTQKQKAYNSTNLSLKYKYNKDLELFAKAQNIFQKKNGLWIADDKIYPVNYSRSYYAGLKYNF